MYSIDASTENNPKYAYLSVIRARQCNVIIKTEQHTSAFIRRMAEPQVTKIPAIKMLIKLK